MYICIDFDGTCVKHQFPELGEDAPYAVEVLKKLVEAGHNLILFTMRSDTHEFISGKEDFIIEKGDFLTQAVNWFEEKGIPLYGVQTNPTQKKWTHSPKAYGHLYIDDSALGCPLIFPVGGERPYVDWKKVEKMLVEGGYCNG